MSAARPEKVSDEDRRVVNPPDTREVALASSGDLWILVQGQLVDLDALALAKTWHR
jgi:hypothetical protein